MLGEVERLREPDSREEFYREAWMTDDQWACAVLVSDVCGGFHHVCGTFKPCTRGIQISLSAHRLSTFDFMALTTLVFLAHDRCIRVEIAGSSPGRTKLNLHRRHKREGAMHERHPTAEEALATHRKSWECDTAIDTAMSAEVAGNG